MFNKILLLLTIAFNVFSCPTVDGLIDYNCDGKIVVTVIGDSFVKGHGDNPKNFGYVGRFALVNPYIKVNKLGGFGLETPQLLKFVKTAIKEKTINYDKFVESDFILIDAGRNDRWLEIPAQETANTIYRIALAIRNGATKFGMSPFVAIARMPNTTRIYQRNFIAEVNKSFDRYYKKANINILNFSKMPSDGISYDGLHPNRAGYIYLYQTVHKYVHGILQTYMSKKRTDIDKDGVYDIAETNKFKTNHLSTDTDLDLITDYDELFYFKTNPNIFDDIESIVEPEPTPIPTPYPLP